MPQHKIKMRAHGKANSPTYAELNKPYQIQEGTPFGIANGLLPPENARWRLIYWDTVVFFANYRAAETYRDGGKWKGRGKNKVRVPNLIYHQREDAIIERQTRTSKRRTK